MEKLNIGIICEGHTDRAVIENILDGTVSNNNYFVTLIRPTLSRDETDLASNKHFSNWNLVQKECESKKQIDPFLFQENTVVVIHIDTDTSEKYAVSKPTELKKSDPDQFAKELRSRVKNKMLEWMQKEDDPEDIVFAIAVEEVEAWVLAIYDNNKGLTSDSANPKEKLRTLISKQGEKFQEGSFDYYRKISSDFSKKRKLLSLMKKNPSLEAFYDEIIQKIKPLIP